MPEQKERRGIYVESEGCFDCIFYESRDKCRLRDGPEWNEVYMAWRNGGFAVGCTLKPKEIKNA
jgi:hypothetical protein